jgi:hypothetical protein
MKKPHNGFRAAVVICTCALVTVGLGYVNIWLGVLALPIMYGLSQDLLS